MRINYKNFLKNNFFSLILSFATVVVIFLSYDRFIVRHDYVVGYEGNCDKATESCFVGCEDDECTVEYYYTKMQKYQPDLYAECGLDITNCEYADACLSGDRECSKIYCDEKTKTEDEICVSGVKDSYIQSDIGSTDSSEESLQDNLDNNI
ncbi:MAG: hypothetical protein WCZ90_20160 [Melioribacteraceae bacterium]